MSQIYSKNTISCINVKISVRNLQRIYKWKNYIKIKWENGNKQKTIRITSYNFYGKSMNNIFVKLIILNYLLFRFLTSKSVSIAVYCAFW